MLFRWIQKKEIVWGGGGGGLQFRTTRFALTTFVHASCQSDILSNHIKGNNKQKTNKPINQGNDKTTLLRFKVTLK